MRKEVVDFIGLLVDENNHSVTLGYYVLNMYSYRTMGVPVSQLPELAKQYEFRNVTWMTASQSIRLKEGYPALLILPAHYTFFGLEPVESFGLSEEPLNEAYVRFKPRKALRSVIDFINKPISGHICALYGLRRTGKTVMLHQAYAYCKEHGINARLFSVDPKTPTTSGQLQHELDVCIEDGVKVVFVDEITFLYDFQQGCANLANHYAGVLTLIVAGTHSLGLYFASMQSLYDRICFIDTSYLSFKEFKYLFPEQTLREYMHRACELGGNDAPYINTHDYIRSSIVENIIHSYKHSRGCSGCTDLQSLDNVNDLQTFITRMIEGYSSHMSYKSLNKTFKSRIYGSAYALAKQHGINITQQRADKILSDYVEALNIKVEASNTISPDVYNVLCKYLQKIGVLASDNSKYKDLDDTVVCQQWGLVYACAAKLLTVSGAEQDFCNILLQDVEGRLLEQILGFETALAYDTAVHKTTVLGREIDFCVYLNDGSYTLNEVKHTDKRTLLQARNFPPDDVVLDFKVASKNIIYLGTTVKGVVYNANTPSAVTVNYINAEEYLLGLYDD